MEPVNCEAIQATARERQDPQACPRALPTRRSSPHPPADPIAGTRMAPEVRSVTSTRIRYPGGRARRAARVLHTAGRPRPRLARRAHPVAAPAADVTARACRWLVHPCNLKHPASCERATEAFMVHGARAEASWAIERARGVIARGRAACGRPPGAPRSAALFEEAPRGRAPSVGAARPAGHSRWPPCATAFVASWLDRPETGRADQQARQGGFDVE